MTDHEPRLTCTCGSGRWPCPRDLEPTAETRNRAEVALVARAVLNSPCLHHLIDSVRAHASWHRDEDCPMCAVWLTYHRGLTGRDD